MVRIGRPSQMASPTKQSLHVHLSEPTWPEAWSYHRHHTGGLCTFWPQPCTLTKHRSCLALPAGDKAQGDHWLESEVHNSNWHPPTESHLLQCRFSASSQPCRSLGTHRLCASPPGLGDRRLKPLQEPLQMDCQWRRLHQSRRSTFRLLLHHQRNHHQWGASLVLTGLQILHFATKCS